MIETTVLAVLIAGAVLYLARRAWGLVRLARAGKGCGCAAPACPVGADLARELAESLRSKARGRDGRPAEAGPPR